MPVDPQDKKVEYILKNDNSLIEGSISLILNNLTGYNHLMTYQE